MVGYLGRKVVQYVLVLVVAVCVNFALPRLAPGDPLDYLLGDASFQLTAEQRQQVLAQFGLDKPTAEQFRDYVVDLAHFRMGTSVRFGQPVGDVVAAVAGGAALVASRRRKGGAGKSDDLSGPEVD